MSEVGGNVTVEWDEPGAGGIYVDGVRVISFGIDTDWRDAWNPKVNEVGLRLMDALPRLVQERELAYQMLREEREGVRAFGGPIRSDTETPSTTQRDEESRP